MPPPPARSTEIALTNVRVGRNAPLLRRESLPTAMASTTGGQAVGAEQFGQYRLEELIGRGGMGEVYRAFDTVRGRVVALKRLPQHLAADAEFQARFRKESALASRLSEPHIVPIHDFGEIDGRLYIDMRLVHGRDLGAVLAAEGPLAPQRAAAVVAQVAAALDAAHADGLVHRDVKPSNILLTGEPGREFGYLVDFGIARTVGSGGGTSITVTGATVGTLDYMAPERFLETGSDHRVDVYALACVLFEALTGHRPFRGEGLPAMIHAHLNLEPPAPSRERAGVPAGLDAVVAKGMAKKPDDRYPSAGALADAVLAAVDAATAVDPATLVVDRPPQTPVPRQQQELAMSQPPQPPYGRHPYGQQPPQAVAGLPGAGFSAPTGGYGGPTPPPKRRWPLVVAAAAVAALAATGAAVAVPMLIRDDPPPAQAAESSTVPPTVAPTTVPPVGPTRPVSAPGGDAGVDQELWDAIGGTGVVWDGGCEYSEPVVAMARSQLDCRATDPALDKNLSFERYPSQAEIDDELAYAEQNWTGEPGSCDTGGRFSGTIVHWDVVCGYATFEDGLTYYVITWRDPNKAILGTLADRDPARAWEWWLAHTPF
jgi:serine/threonine protein kinase